MFLQYWFGKQKDGQKKLIHSSFSAGKSPLIYLTDTLSNHRFLIDTGATISLFHHRSKGKPSSLQLIAANGQSIPSWGSHIIPLQFGNCRFKWDFKLAAVHQALLGTDFLKTFNLLVDVAGKQVLDASSLQIISSSVLSRVKEFGLILNLSKCRFGL